MIPERLRLLENWTLLYSLEQDGASLATLYQKCRVYEGQRVGLVLVVKDQEGGVSSLPTVVELSTSARNDRRTTTY